MARHVQPERTPDPVKDLEQLSHAMSQLPAAVVRLQMDVARLAARLKPVDGEPVPTDVHPPASLSPNMRMWPRDKITLHSIAAIVMDAKSLIDGCERDVRSIRARVDVIEADVVPRAEMKKYLVSAPGGGSQLSTRARDRRG